LTFACVFEFPAEQGVKLPAAATNVPVHVGSRGKFKLGDNMKKTGLAILAAIFVVAACGKANAVKDYGELFDDGTRSLQALGKDFEAAKDGKAVAAAIEKFVGLMQSFKDKGEALEKKHGMSVKGEMPAELKAKADAFEKAAEELGKGPMTQAMMKYAASPEVKAAMDKLESLR
jgi:hypothetical protein